MKTKSDNIFLLLAMKLTSKGNNMVGLYLALVNMQKNIPLAHLSNQEKHLCLKNSSMKLARTLLME